MKPCGLRTGKFTGDRKMSEKVNVDISYSAKGTEMVTNRFLPKWTSAIATWAE